MILGTLTPPKRIELATDYLRSKTRNYHKKFLYGLMELRCLAQLYTKELTNRRSHVKEKDV
jgi:hypothetical protein